MTQDQAADAPQRRPRPSAKRLRLVALAMFILGIPVGSILYFHIKSEGKNPFAFPALIGYAIWISWLVRLIWPSMPRAIRLSIWVPSTIWHLLFLPVAPFGILHPIAFYLVLHCLVMLGLSLNLIRDDSPELAT